MYLILGRVTVTFSCNFINFATRRIIKVGPKLTLEFLIDFLKIIVERNLQTLQKIRLTALFQKRKKMQLQNKFRIEKTPPTPQVIMIASNLITLKLQPFVLADDLLLSKHVNTIISLGKFYTANYLNQSLINKII